MNFIKFLTVFFFSIIWNYSYTQHEDHKQEHHHEFGHINGIVNEISDNGDESPIPGVNVYWAGTTTGTSSDKDGHFHIIRIEDFSIPLVISYIGYKNDSIVIPADTEEIEIELKVNNTLKTVIIANKAPGGAYFKT